MASDEVEFALLRDVEGPPDWTLHLPDAFIVSHPPFGPFMLGVIDTHKQFQQERDEVRMLDIWRGWYGEDRAAGAAALAPLMAALTEWRDRRRA